LRDTIDVVVCLRDLVGQIGSSLPLRLVSSKPSKDAKVQEVFDAFSRTAKRMAIPFEIVHKKINVSASEFAWEHEHYAKRKLFALTLTASDGSPASLYGVFDSRSRVDVVGLTQRTQLIAETLASIMYPSIADVTDSLFQSLYGVRQDFIASRVEALASVARFAPFMTRDSKSAAAVLQQIERDLSMESAVDVKRTAFKLVTDNKYYGEPMNSMTLSKAKPVSFELAVSGAVAVYLAGLAFGLGGKSFYESLFEQVRRAIQRRRAALKR